NRSGLGRLRGREEPSSAAARRWSGATERRLAVIGEFEQRLLGTVGLFVSRIRVPDSGQPIRRIGGAPGGSRDSPRQTAGAQSTAMALPRSERWLRRWTPN